MVERKFYLCFDIVFVYDRSQVDVFLKKIDLLVIEGYMYKFEKTKKRVMFSISFSSTIDRSFMLYSF